MMMVALLYIAGSMKTQCLIEYSSYFPLLLCNQIKVEFSLAQCWVGWLQVEYIVMNHHHDIQIKINKTTFNANQTQPNLYIALYRIILLRKNLIISLLLRGFVRLPYFYPFFQLKEQRNSNTDKRKLLFFEWHELTVYKITKIQSCIHNKHNICGKTTKKHIFNGIYMN